jgi:hypothetical protein
MARMSLLRNNIPKSSDYFFYNKMGNVGFIGYSGAYSFDDMKNYFSEACSWAAEDTSLDVLLLVGHWNNEVFLSFNDEFLLIFICMYFILISYVYG